MHGRARSSRAGSRSSSCDGRLQVVAYAASADELPADLGPWEVEPVDERLGRALARVPPRPRGRRTGSGSGRRGSTHPQASPAVVIDPGRAFGTGGHATTLASLELLASLPPAARCSTSAVARASCRSPRCASGSRPSTPATSIRSRSRSPLENASRNGVVLEPFVADALVDTLPDAPLWVANILRRPLEVLLGTSRRRAARDRLGPAERRAARRARVPRRAPRRARRVAGDPARTTMTKHVHRVFVSANGESGELLELEPTDRRHLERVLRMRPGAGLEVVDGAGTVFAAVLEDRGMVRLGALVAERTRAERPRRLARKRRRPLGRRHREADRARRPRGGCARLRAHARRVPARPLGPCRVRGGPPVEADRRAGPRRTDAVRRGRRPPRARSCSITRRRTPCRSPRQRTRCC